MMYDIAVAMAWFELAARWLHIITAIAWIGSSFYFIALDLGLRQAANLPPKAYGEEWQVHGGGFYHIQKYLVAPDTLPEHLTWFKWESYATWMSGFALMFLLYYTGADLYLIDPNIADISPLTAIIISIASMVIVWFAYSAICYSKFGQDNRRLMILLYVLLVLMAWGFTQVFTGRAALLHLGVVTATIMAANVFLVIIPNQKIVVADLIAGKIPDSKYGEIAKQRSTHNNYLTLPVIFLMMSNHYPLVFATEYNWIIGSLVFLMGVTIRHYFNTRHARKGNPHWTWALTTILFLIIMWLSLLPQQTQNQNDIKSTRAYEKYITADGFENVHDVIIGHCSMCHAKEPSFDGIFWAPKNIILETPEDIAIHAKEIYLQAGITHAMPPANISGMTQSERAKISTWFNSVPYFNYIQN